jgi:hypothetical protein
MILVLLMAFEISVAWHSVSYSVGFTKSGLMSWRGVSRYRPPPTFHSLDSDAAATRWSVRRAIKGTRC